MTDLRSIADRYAAADFDAVAFNLHTDFLRLKHALVQRRKSEGLSRQQVADFLGIPEDEVAQFEQYYYDPKASEIRQYALAVMMEIKTECRPFIAPVYYGDQDIQPLSEDECYTGTAVMSASANAGQWGE